MYSEVSLYLCVALAVATKVKDIPSHPLLTIFSLVTEQPEVINLSEVETVSSRMSEPDVFGDQHREDPADSRHNKRSYRLRFVLNNPTESEIRHDSQVKEGTIWMRAIS